VLPADLCPRSIAHRRALGRGVHDVGEQDGREHPVELDLVVADPPGEPLHVLEHLVGRVPEEHVVIEGKTRSTGPSPKTW